MDVVTNMGTQAEKRGWCQVLMLGVNGQVKGAVNRDRESERAVKVEGHTGNSECDLLNLRHLQTARER
jgi:hypothetical protein